MLKASKGFVRKIDIHIDIDIDIVIEKLQQNFNMVQMPFYRNKYLLPVSYKTYKI